MPSVAERRNSLRLRALLCIRAASAHCAAQDAIATVKLPIWSGESLSLRDLGYTDVVRPALRRRSTQRPPRTVDDDSPWRHAVVYCCRGLTTTGSCAGAMVPISTRFTTPTVRNKGCTAVDAYMRLVIAIAGRRSDEATGPDPDTPHATVQGCPSSTASASPTFST